MPARFLNYDKLRAFGEANGKTLITSSEGFVLGTLNTKPWEFLASDYGFSTSASGTTNSAALQAAIDAANTAGGGEVLIGSGTFTLNAVSAIYTRPGSVGNNKKNCIAIKDNVTIKGVGPHLTHLKLAASQQTNLVIVHMFWADNGVDDWAMLDMKITGNTANQPGYTGGYTGGDTAGALIAAGGGIFGTGNERVTLRNLILEENFGCAIDNVFPTKWNMEEILIDKVGEGMLVNGYDQMNIYNCTYNNSTAVSVGDAFEIANGNDLTMNNIKAFDAVAGSALDITGRHMVLSNIVCDRCQNGVLIQTDAATESFPNSDIFALTNVTVSNGDAIGISVAANRTNGTCNGTLSNCTVKNMSQGFLISSQTGGGGFGTITLNNCQATGHDVVGLHLMSVDKIIVNGGFFGNSATAGYGIILNGIGSTASGQQKIYIYDATCSGNDRFGVYVQAGTDGVTYFPEGIVRVNAFNNSNGDMTYFNGLNGMSYEGQDIYFKDNTHTGLELTNTRLDETTPSRTHTRVVTGYKTISWENLKLRQLQQGVPNQEIVIKFPVICTVEALATTAGNNVELDTDNDGDATFAAGDQVVLQYDVTTSKWKEATRKQSYQLPFGPDQVTGFRCWYKSTANLYQGTGGSGTLASATDDPVGSWTPFQGSGPTFAAPSTKPKRSAGGGIYNAGASATLQALAVSLVAPYTIVFRIQAPAAYFTLHRFFSCNNGASNWQLFESNSLLSTAAFYENTDPSAVVLSTTYDPLAADLVVGIGVSSGGIGQGYKSDGSLITLGATASSASANLYMLSYLNSAFDGQKALRDFTIFDSLISQSDFQQLQAYLL